MKEKLTILQNLFNFARPFIVGNTITVKDVSGVVEEISLAYTFLTTEDEERITIPNNQIVGEIIQNSFGYKKSMKKQHGHYRPIRWQ